MSEATTSRLCDATLVDVPEAVPRPGYDRTATRIGIVHLGAGAFHRAHQAVYIDDLLAAEPDWAICAVSLHSREMRDALRPQDGLYTLVRVAEQTTMRVIGSIREVLCARDERAAVLARLADPGVRLVTLTITEKGYCLAQDRLDLAHPEIVHDLASPQAPDGAIGYLVAALQRRRASGVAPFTVLSCDNLADNGGKLRRAVLQFAERIDPPLAQWIGEQVAFPRSMVDSITPATDDALRESVATRLGCVDAWPIKREPYTQWVVEDHFCNGRPLFERAGVTLSDDIAGHDRAKLRLLNAPHSALAYLGSLLKMESVFEAMGHGALSSFVERLMREAIVPNLAAPRGFDADAYVSAILARFRNPAIRHLLAQIAWDGSQKIPVRLLGTIGDALAAGRAIDMLCLPIAAWMQFVRRQARAGVPLVDPLAEALLATGHATNGDAEHDVGLFLAHRQIFATLADDTRFETALRARYAALGDGAPEAVEHALQHHVRTIVTA
jgi:fructuronate reductase